MFKESFKFYKAKWPTPDFSEVLDFEQQINTEMVREISIADAVADVIDKQPPPGVEPTYAWRCYELLSHPGLQILRHAFTTQGQRYWIARCLRDYPVYPNPVNLNAELFTRNVIENWWHELQHCSDLKAAHRIKSGMRWTTLGYHHDWNTKVYSEQQHSKFPADLAAMCNYFAQQLGYDNYNSQAAIVNYYPIGTTLAGHTDHSEVDLAAPLFSFSFGQTAIFLIGGTSKEEKPTALYLQSGDIVVMSRASRLCYHAVPRVMKAQNELWNAAITTANDAAEASENLKNHTHNWQMDLSLFQQIADETFWLPFRNYLSDSRININVRQVLPAGCAHLPES